MSRYCRPFILAVMLFVCNTAMSADETENLLTNGRFAPNGEASLVDGWSSLPSDHDVSLDKSETPPDVANSLRVDIRRQQSGWGQIIQRLYRIQPRTSYRFSVMVRSSVARLGVLQVKLYQDRKETKRISSDRSTAEWQRLVIDFSSEDADKIELLLRFVADKPETVGQTVWFADVKLTVSPPPELTKVEAVGTFRSLSVTAHYEGGANADHVCQLRYRAEGESLWRPGMDLVHYAPDHQFRGSLLMLKPNQRYQVACRLIEQTQDEADVDQNTVTASASSLTAVAQTWSEEVPIGEVRHLPKVTDGPIDISARGTPDAWILYSPAEGSTATINAGHDEEYAVRISECAYVVLQNVIVRGGLKNGIRIGRSHHIRVRRCDIADWSEPGTPNENLENGLYVDAGGRVINFRAGVRVAEGSSQVVVEDNYIHHPRGTANSWGYGHPAGPQGVILDRTGGNNVVRNNEIIGSEEHWWNDGIESIRNSDPDGGPYRDTDIYGNTLAFQNDDGIELDGGQINVRCFNNWIDKALCGVSCAPNRRGPSYVFRNLILLTGEERLYTGAGFKMGGDRFEDPGVSLLLHNTVYSHRAGLTAGHYGKGPTPIRSRNNLFTGPFGSTGGNYYRHASGADFAYDLVPPGSIAADSPWQIQHGLVGRPEFRDVMSGDFRLAESSLGIDAGVPLATLNDNWVGDGPDLGAFERGDDKSAVFPKRADGMWALPLRSMIDFVPSQPKQAELEIQVPTNVGSTWEAHTNSPWLKCTPNRGTCGDKPQIVRVSLVDGDHAVRLHRGAVTFRTDNGLNRSVMVDFRVMPESYVAIPCEAESGEVSGKFRKVEDVTASGGFYLDTDEGDNGSVRFTVEIPTDGTYYITGRTLVPGPAEEAGVHDSFEITVDDGPRLRWDLVRAAPDQWIWCLAAPERTPPHAFQLAAGTHTITVYSRERLARIDRLVVTTAPYAEPVR